MKTIILTVEEIKDLAKFAGLIVRNNHLSEDERETEIAIGPCPAQGVQDDEEIIHCRHIAHFEEYPEEGVMPLGKVRRE